MHKWQIETTAHIIDLAEWMSAPAPLIEIAAALVQAKSWWKGGYRPPLYSTAGLKEKIKGLAMNDRRVLRAIVAPFYFLMSKAMDEDGRKEVADTMQALMFCVQANGISAFTARAWETASARAISILNEFDNPKRAEIDSGGLNAIMERKVLLYD